MVIYPEDVPNRGNLQNTAHHVHDKKMERWEKRVELYETHKRNLCISIARKCEKELLNKLEHLPDYMEFSFYVPLRFLQKATEPYQQERGNDSGGAKWSLLMSPTVDVHTNLHQGGLNLREVILLDSQSTTNVFCNPKFVENIRHADTPLCLDTSCGVLITTLKATVPSFGEVWFNPDAIANIFCMADIDDKYGMDRAIVSGKKAIRVITDPPVDFVRRPEKLYFFPPKKFRTDTKLSDYTFVDSVEENRLFFTSRQFDRTKRARQLYHTLGSPSVKDFKGIIRMNCIRDNTVTTEDIEIAETIFGPDIGVLKGKSTHHRPTP
jgi:hypothetical protein